MASILAFVIWQMVHIALHVLNKYFCWLERWNEVLRYINGYVALDVAPDFFLSSFDYEASKTPDVNIVAASE